MSKVIGRIEVIRASYFRWRWSRQWRILISGHNMFDDDISKNILKFPGKQVAVNFHQLYHSNQQSSCFTKKKVLPMFSPGSPVFPSNSKSENGPGMKMYFLYTKRWCFSSQHWQCEFTTPSPKETRYVLSAPLPTNNGHDPALSGS